jgi:hypothetical protein
MNAVQNIPAVITKFTFGQPFAEKDQNGNLLPLVGSMRDGTYTEWIAQDNDPKMGFVSKQFRIVDGIRCEETPERMIYPD